MNKKNFPKTPRQPAYQNKQDKPLAYRLLTGTDDRQFCERVSEAIDSGYQLYGSPTITFNGKNCIVAQAIIRSPISRPRFRSDNNEKPYRPQFNNQKNDRKK